MQFETIIGFTREEADAIVRGDTWFADNVNNDDVQRYIKYETDATGKHVTSITRSNNPAEGHVKADKTLDIKNIVLDTEEKIAAYLFSVNANKGPNIEVKKFFMAGGKVASDTEKKFLGHVAWLVGNKGYGSSTDLLCKYERLYMGRKDLPMLDTSTGREIFNTFFYTVFKNIVFELYKSHSLFRFAYIPEERTRIIEGMSHDLRLVNRFL